MVLQWDVKRLRTRITQIEKAKDVPSMEQRIALEDYVKKTQEEQEMLRAQSSQYFLRLPFPLEKMSEESQATPVFD